MTEDLETDVLVIGSGPAAAAPHWRWPRSASSTW
jgi:hypothetical protein